jgi:hypothetical protein
VKNASVAVRAHKAIIWRVVTWLSLKVKANQLNNTLYQAKTDLWRDYLRAELRNPRIPAFQSA